MNLIACTVKWCRFRSICSNRNLYDITRTAGHRWQRYQCSFRNWCSNSHRHTAGSWRLHRLRTLGLVEFRFGHWHRHVQTRDTVETWPRLGHHVQRQAPAPLTWLASSCAVLWLEESIMALELSQLRCFNFRIHERSSDVIFTALCSVNISAYLCT